MSEEFDLRGKRVWIAGHRGMVGSAIARRLDGEACTLLFAQRGEVDLRRQSETEAWLDENKPDLIFLAAAKVGGILANSVYPADFLYDNLVIEANIIHGAFKAGTKKLVFLGSSCIYPKYAQQPIVEDALLTGALEPTNEWYAIAKIAGIKLCQAYWAQHNSDFISAMPTNLYGPGDNFDLAGSHVLPALIRKAHEARHAGAAEMNVWGSGTPRREFLHVDDCADALVYLAKHYSGKEHVNIGSGSDLPISELVEIVTGIVGYKGKIVYDRSKPDGAPRKLMSAKKLSGMNWQPRINLPNGIASVYEWYKSHIGE